MGCGASKVDPSIQVKVKPPQNKPNGSICNEKINNNNKTRSLESVKSSSKTKLLTERPSSASGSLKLTETPKKDKNFNLVRDSNGSIKAQTCSTVNSELERKNSKDLAKKDSRAELFAAKPSTPVQSIQGENGVQKPKPMAFVVELDHKPVAGRPPRRLESIVNPPKPLTEEELKEKIRQKTERRELELQRKKLKSSRMSRRKRDLIDAMEQSKIQDQADELKNKMQSTGDNRERIKAERIEKQRKHKEHVEKVRERAKKIKAGEELDEGLGGEIETYKNTSDDEVNIWSSKDDEVQDRPNNAKNKNSRVSLDTLDSGVSKLKEDSVDDFYNA